MNWVAKGFPILGALALISALALAACGKEEKAEPTKAPSSPTTAASAPGATPTKPPAPAATQAPSTPTAAAVLWEGHNAKLAGYLQKYNPNDPKNYKPEKDVPPKYGGEVSGAFGTPADWDFTKKTDNNLISHGPLIYSASAMTALRRGDNLIAVTDKPDMMESWQQAPDGLSWTFKLRKGMKWQNRPPLNGRPVTIQDMKYGLDLLRTTPAQKVDYGDIQDVVVVDDETLKVITKKPFPDLVHTLSGPHSMIIAKECYEDDNCRLKAPVGAGAFMLDSMEPRVKVRFVKNPDYYGKDEKGNKLPFLDAVNSFVFADVAAQVAALRTGKIDNYYSLGEREFLDINKTNPELIVGLVGPSYEIVPLANQIHLKYGKGKPWDDPRVRKAMSMAMDRESMIRDAFDGIATPGIPVPFNQWGLSFYPPLSKLPEGYQYDAAKAKKLLTEAGYPNGFKIKVMQAAGSGPNWNALLVWQQNWKAVGIDMELVPAADATALNGALFAGSWEEGIFLPSNTGGWARPALAAYNVLHSKGANNFEKLSDPKLDELLDKAQATGDPNERAKVLRQVMDYEGENQHVLYGASYFRFELMTARTHRMAGGPDHRVFGFGERTLIETWVDK